MFNPYRLDIEFANAHLSKLDHSPEIIKIMYDWCMDPKHIFYFNGTAGVGKTYFSAAFYNYLIEKRCNVRMYSEGYLFDELKLCIGMSSWEIGGRMQTICEADYLIIDDMGSTKISDWTKEMLFKLVDLRYNSHKPTLITSNWTQKIIKENFHERFSSRLFAARNVILELNETDRRKSLTT